MSRFVRLCVVLLIFAAAVPVRADDAPTTGPAEAGPSGRPARADHSAVTSQPAEPSPMQRLARPTTRPDRAAASQPDTTAELPIEQRAFVRAKVGKYEQAEKDLQQLAGKDASRVAASLALVEVYFQTGKYEQADRTLGEIAERAKGNPADLARWRCAKAELLAKRGQYEQALELAEAALKDDANDLHARWLAGQQLETLGKADQAVEVYKLADEQTAKAIPASAEQMTWAGRCLDRYSRLIGKPVTFGTRILQTLYQDGYEKVDRQYWPARVAAADLSLAAYKTQQAAEDYMAALKINPRAYQANLGIGWALLENWQFEKVEQQVEAAKKVNPADPDIFQLEASLRMQERNYPAAEAAAQAALKTNPRHLPSLALLASARLRQGDRKAVEELTAKAEAINPRPAEFYFIMAEWQSAARQFESAERYYKKAIELSPNDPNPMTSLGMMYMQTGEEDKAGRILETAFAIDRYNRRSFNTLTLLDQLVSFDTLQSEHFTIKFNRTSDAVLGPYFRDYLEGIYGELSRDFNIELPRKSVIEIFPSHQQFSVRTTGRPWIPTVGACTGWVVAMYSPREMAGTEKGFNWSRVLRHEFVHVVTLAATENRIPHWFTEGLAVNSEQQPRDWQWVAMLAGALRTEQLFTVDKLDWGFIRPRRPTDRQMAYAQSQWMVEFIISQFGYAKINELLAAYRGYKTQPQAFEQVLGVSEKQFDEQFRAWARKQVAEEWRMPSDPIPKLAEAQKQVKARPADADALGELAVAFFYARKAKESEKAAREALAINPRQVKALSVLCTLLGEGRWDENKPLLMRLAEVDPTVDIAPKLLARRALRDDQLELAAFWFNRLKTASPLDPLSYTGLAGIYLRQNDAARAVVELAELARREQHSPKFALQLATLYTQLGKPDQSALWLEEAMHIDPFNPSIHERLAVALLANRQPDRAIGEMKVAIQLRPDDANLWARLAFIYHGQGDKNQALRAARFSLKLDPASPARELLGDTPAQVDPQKLPVRPLDKKDQPDLEVD